MPNTELPMDLESQVVLMKKYITFRQRKKMREFLGYAGYFRASRYGKFLLTQVNALLLLAQNAGLVFSKEQIYDCVWKEPYFGDYNIVMSHIRNLREKIEDNPSKPMYIQTVWGVGYRFNKNLSSGL